MHRGVPSEGQDKVEGETQPEGGGIRNRAPNADAISFLASSQALKCRPDKAKGELRSIPGNGSGDHALPKVLSIHKAPPFKTPTLQILFGVAEGIKDVEQLRPHGGDCVSMT